MYFDKLALILCAVTLCGCAVKPILNKPSDEQFAKADFGQEVSVEDFNQLAKERLNSNLIDPLSLIYYAPLKLGKSYATDLANNIYYGYFGCYDYNSKNRMGGYAGRSRECLLVRDDVILQRYVKNDRDDNLTPEIMTIDRTINSSEIKSKAQQDINGKNIAKRFDPTRLRELSPGISTTTDAIRIFGEANSEFTLGNGTILLQWMKASESSAAHIGILFNANKIMIRVNNKFTQ